MYSPYVCYQRWSQRHKARGQGQEHKKISRPRTELLEAKDQEHRSKCFPKKKGLQKILTGDLKKRSLKVFFQVKKVLNFFFRRSPREENKKRTSQIFHEVSCVFQQNFNGSRYSGVLEPRTGQFSRT